MTGVAPDLARAQAMLDLKRYDQAANLLALVVAVEPTDSRAWCLLAQAHLGNAQCQEAVAAAKQAITLAPSDAWPYRLASIAHGRLGHSTSAWKAATEACKLAPDEWQSYVCLAQAELARQVDSEAAERAAAHARRLAPDEPEVHYVSGLVSFSNFDWTAARIHQERVLALDPGDSRALNELGRINLRRRRPGRAAQHFIHAAQSAPGQSIYGQNVDIAVRSAVALSIYIASMGNFALLYMTMIGNPPRTMIVIGLAAVAALGAGFGAVQLWRMPPETHPLFRTRRVALAVATAYGSILIVVVAAAVTPASALAGTLMAGIWLIFASRFAVWRILRPKPRRSRSLDHALPRLSADSCRQPRARAARHNHIGTRGNCHALVQGGRLRGRGIDRVPGCLIGAGALGRGRDRRARCRCRRAGYQGGVLPQAGFVEGSGRQVRGPRHSSPLHRDNAPYVDDELTRLKREMGG
jgi:Flp pilus assembly protein TadD